MSAINGVPTAPPGRALLPVASICKGSPDDPGPSWSQQNEELDNREARVLVEQARIARHGIHAKADTLLVQCREVRERFAAAQGAVDRVAAVTRTPLPEVPPLSPRTASRAPMSRWLALVLIIAAALFDTGFFKDVFLNLVDASWSWTDLNAYLAVLPAFGLAAGNILSGIWIAQLLERRLHRPRPDTRADGPTGPDAAELDARGTTPLRIPAVAVIVYVAVVLTTLIIWAYQRGVDASTSFPPMAVALFVIMLTFTAIAAKVASYVPEGEHRGRERRVVRAAQRSRAVRLWYSSRWLGKARHAVTACRFAGDRLRATVLAVDAEARNTMDDGWLRILDERAARGIPDGPAPAFTELLTEPMQTRSRYQPQLFTGIGEPIVLRNTLDDAERVLAECDATGLGVLLERIAEHLYRLPFALSQKRTDELLSQEGRPPDQAAGGGDPDFPPIARNPARRRQDRNQPLRLRINGELAPVGKRDAAVARSGAWSENSSLPAREEAFRCAVAVA